MSAATAEAVEALPAGPPARSLPRLGSAALPLLLVLGLVTLCPASAAAQGDDDSSALALLRRALVAASTVSYQGTQIDATWTPNGMTTRMIDVQQVGGELRSITVRGGDGSGSTTTIPLRAAGSGGSVIDPLTLLAGAYALALAGRDTLLGRSTTEVVALRQTRVAARLWIDDVSGIVLRQEVWDTQGRLTRMVGFVDLTGVGGATEHVTPQPVTSSSVGSFALHPSVGATPSGGRQAAGTQPDPAAGDGVLTGALTSAPGPTGGSGSAAEVDPQTTARELDSPCPGTLPGGYRLVDARAVSVPTAGGQTSALHLTYSDGLSALSVFVQSGRLPAGGPSGMTTQTWSGQRVYVGTGWPVRVVWEGGGHVFTAVSDAPVDELTAAVNALPGQRSATGVLDRLSVILRTVTLLLPGR